MENGKKGNNTSKPRTAMLVVLLALLVTSSYFSLRKEDDSKSVSKQLPVVRVEGTIPTPAPTSELTEQTEVQETFASYKNERNDMRAREITMLDEIINDAKTASDLNAQAKQQKLALVASMEEETTLEGILKAKGFEDALVSSKDGSVTIVIKKEQIGSSELTQILEVAMRETGEGAQNIKIMTRK